MADDNQPTAAQTAAAGEVATAAGTAIAESAAAGETRDQATERARAAVRGTAARTQLELSDEDVSRLVDALIERMASLGAFDPPAPVEPATAAAPAAEASAEASAEAAAAQPPPAKRTFAERYAGR